MWAWVFDSGEGSQQASPAEVAQWCAANGYAWSALEIDDERFNPQTWWPAFRDAHLARGVIPGTWNTEGGNIYKTPSDAHFAICEIEGPGDWEGVANVIDGVGAGPLPTCSKAIITNFNFDPAGAAKLRNAGFSVLTEAYLNENPSASPENMDNLARAYGWSASQAVAGVYPVGGMPPPSYEQWDFEWPMADYLGEYLIHKPFVATAATLETITRKLKGGVYV